MGQGWGGVWEVGVEGVVGVRGQGVGMGWGGGEGGLGFGVGGCG